jgi:probable HAF family extracellular repeat protein
LRTQSDSPAKECDLGEGEEKMRVSCGPKTVLMVFVCLFVVLACVSSANAVVGFEELGILSGHSHAQAYDISGDGSTVVGWCWNILPSGWPEGRAFRWKDGTMTNLGVLPGYPGGNMPENSIAFGVSGDGSVVVGLSGSHPHDISSDYCWAFRWSGGAMSPLLGPVIPGYVAASCSAKGVSADGSVVVGNVVGSDLAHSDLSDACRWAGGPAMFLGSPWPYPYNNYAKRVSADGSVVVGAGSGGGFRWKAGTIISIGGGAGNQGCNGVSADGSVVVGVGSGGEGFRWENGAMTNLGQCIPHDVSADGSVIVGERWDGAFIWDANHGMRNLREVLVNDYLIDLQAYPNLWGARGISDDGFRILVGEHIATLDMGMITDVSGNVTLDTLKAKMLDHIRRLSTVETAADGKVRIRHPSGSEINLGPNSKMQIDGSVSKTNIEFFKGQLFQRIGNHPGPLWIQTYFVNGAVRGTEMIVEATSTESKTIVLEGEADVSTPDGSQHVLLGENQGVIATDTGLGIPFDVDPNQIDRWWEWADQGDFYANFDLEYICQTPLRAILFEASTQEVTPDWTLELENSGGLSGPDWHIDSLTFEAPYELFDLDPEPDIVAGHDYVWTGGTLGPGEDGQINAEQNTSWEPVYLPYTIGREFAGNPITAEGDLTTTVIVTPGDDIRGFEVSISACAAENERAREEGDFFGTLSHVSYSTNADTASDFDHESTPISQEYEWEFWDGYLPGQALTFTVTVHVDLDADVDSALIEPRVEVAGKMDADSGSEAWVENRLDLVPQDAAIIIDSNEPVGSSDSYIPWIGVDMPQYVELTGTATVPTPPGHDVPITLLEGEVNLTFETVQTEGDTSVTYCPSGPDMPANFQIQGRYYDISTTAVCSGAIEICFNYDDSGLTQDQEQALQILHYDVDHWEDVTTGVDTTNNVICGEVTAFSEFVVALPTVSGQDADGDGYEADVDCNDNDPTINPAAAEVCDGVDNNCDGLVDDVYVFGAFQQPINSDGSSIFKAGRTVPVKVRLADCDGVTVADATVSIAVEKILDVIVGTVEELAFDSSGNANTGTLFRYDDTDEQYIYNLSTRSLSNGTYRIHVICDKAASCSVDVSLK